MAQHMLLNGKSRNPAIGLTIFSPFPSELLRHEVWMGVSVFPPLPKVLIVQRVAHTALRCRAGWHQCACWGCRGRGGAARDNIPAVAREPSSVWHRRPLPR